MPDVIDEARVRMGADPDWRLAWEELLDADRRRHVEHTVSRGEAADDPDLAMFAVGYANRVLARARWFLVLTPLLLAVTALWIWGTCFRVEGSAFDRGMCALYVLIGLLLLTVIPWLQIRSYRRITRSLHKNEDVLRPRDS